MGKMAAQKAQMWLLLPFKKMTQINTGVPHWETHGSSTIIRGKSQYIVGILLRELLLLLPE